MPKIGGFGFGVIKLALLKQFSQMRQMMKMLKGGKMKALMRGLGGKLPGMGGKFPF